MGVKGGPNTTWRRGPMYTLEVSPSFYADKDENVDKDEDVEEREATLGFGGKPTL